MSDGRRVYQRNRNCDPRWKRFTQEDPIGLAGGANLYGFAGGDRVNFGDPLGLCPAGTHPASEGEGSRIMGAASALADEVTYRGGAGGSSSVAGGSDCSGFVMLSMQRAGFSGPYTQSTDFAKSADYEKVSGIPQAGDVMWQPGHVGLYTGHNYSGMKNPSALQIGSSKGVREAPFGAGGWFKGGGSLSYYRRCVPDNPSAEKRPEK